jgi:hypothetical protein
MVTGYPKSEIDNLPSDVSFCSHHNSLFLSVSRSSMLCSTFVRSIKEDRNRQLKMGSSLT